MSINPFKAYRQAALIAHPDKNPDKSLSQQDKERRFKAILRARDVLLDAEQRGDVDIFFDLRMEMFDHIVGAQELAKKNENILPTSIADQLDGHADHLKGEARKYGFTEEEGGVICSGIEDWDALEVGDGFWKTQSANMRWLRNAWRAVRNWLHGEIAKEEQRRKSRHQGLVVVRNEAARRKAEQDEKDRREYEEVRARIIKRQAEKDELIRKAQRQQRAKMAGLGEDWDGTEGELLEAFAREMGRKAGEKAKAEGATVVWGPNGFIATYPRDPLRKL